MSIFQLNIPYNNFEVGKLIDPSEFNSNNGAIQSKLNEVIAFVNTFQIVNEDGEIVIPNFLTETAILPTEIQSPTITGNALIGVSGLVGTSSVGSTGSSVRIWAGDSDRNYAPFQVMQDGTVTMRKANITTASDLNVTGNVNLTGDIYVNGVKMALTPAE